MNMIPDSIGQFLAELTPAERDALLARLLRERIEQHSANAFRVVDAVGEIAVVVPRITPPLPFDMNAPGFWEELERRRKTPEPVLTEGEFDQLLRLREEQPA